MANYIYLLMWDGCIELLGSSVKQDLLKVSICGVIFCLLLKLGVLQKLFVEFFSVGTLSLILSVVSVDRESQFICTCTFQIIEITTKHLTAKGGKISFNLQIIERFKLLLQLNYSSEIKSFVHSHTNISTDKYFYSQWCRF